jgi:hypothetical protein
MIQHEHFEMLYQSDFEASDSGFLRLTSGPTESEPLFYHPRTPKIGLFFGTVWGSSLFGAPESPVHQKYSFDIHSTFSSYKNKVSKRASKIFFLWRHTEWKRSDEKQHKINPIDWLYFQTPHRSPSLAPMPCAEKNIFHIRAWYIPPSQTSIYDHINISDFIILLQSGLRENRFSICRAIWEDSGHRETM